MTLKPLARKCATEDSRRKKIHVIDIERVQIENLFKKINARKNSTRHILTIIENKDGSSTCISDMTMGDIVYWMEKHKYGIMKSTTSGVDNGPQGTS